MMTDEWMSVSRWQLRRFLLSRCLAVVSGVVCLGVFYPVVVSAKKSPIPVNKNALAYNELPKYWIASSHNTYIKNLDQWSPMNAKHMYHAHLNRYRGGVLEIDLSSYRDGVIGVSHRGFPGAALNLKMLIEGIRAWAIANPDRWPIVLTFDDKLTKPFLGQSKPEIRRDVWGMIIDELGSVGERHAAQIYIRGLEAPQNDKCPGKDMEAGGLLECRSDFIKLGCASSSGEVSTESCKRAGSGEAANENFVKVCVAETEHDASTDSKDRKGCSFKDTSRCLTTLSIVGDKQCNVTKPNLLIRHYPLGGARYSENLVELQSKVLAPIGFWHLGRQMIALNIQHADRQNAIMRKVFEESPFRKIQPSGASKTIRLKLAYAKGDYKPTSVIKEVSVFHPTDPLQVKKAKFDASGTSEALTFSGVNTSLPVFYILVTSASKEVDKVVLHGAVELKDLGSPAKGENQQAFSLFRERSPKARLRSIGERGSLGHDVGRSNKGEPTSESFHCLNAQDKPVPIYCDSGHKESAAAWGANLSVTWSVTK